MTHRFVLGSDQVRERVDIAVTRLMQGSSRATVQRWISEGRVRIDGRPCRASSEVDAGRVVEVDPSPPRPSTVAPDASVVIEALYEDEYLIVVNKPAGMVVHPGRGHWTGTLVSGLLARQGFERAPFDARDPHGPIRPGIVHRIDKDTSGVLVAAKDEPTREGLKAQLSAHSVERIYRAITVGVPRGTRFETLHARRPGCRFRFTSMTETGRRAVTNVQVDEKLAGGRAALVTCRLETGRTHQIRVHLAERAGAPILADSLYGRLPTDESLRAVAVELRRQALHAQVLGFSHPATGEWLRFESPLPDDFAHALGRLRRLT